MISAVLFDLDGTLVDTWRLYIECYRRVLQAQAGARYSAADIAALRPKAEIRFFLDAPYRADFDRYYTAFLREYAEAHASFCDGWYPGAREVVDAVRSRELGLGIVTGKGRAAYEITEAALNLPRMDASICDDDVNRPKPDPEGIRLACHRLQVSPTQIIYVGDSQVDYAAALDAGARFAGVLWSKGADEQADFQAGCAPTTDAERQRVRLCEEPSDILVWLDEIRA